jgi:hypothetical protein
MKARKKVLTRQLAAKYVKILLTPCDYGSTKFMLFTAAFVSFRLTLRLSLRFLSPERRLASLR